MSYLVANPEDRFSHDAAQIDYSTWATVDGLKSKAHGSLGCRSSVTDKVGIR